MSLLPAVPSRARCDYFSMRQRQSSASSHARFGLLARRRDRSISRPARFERLRQYKATPGVCSSAVSGESGLNSVAPRPGFRGSLLLLSLPANGH